MKNDKIIKIIKEQMFLSGLNPYRLSIQLGHGGGYIGRVLARLEAGGSVEVATLSKIGEALGFTVEINIK